jgi:putative sugar O-methyltransferase
MYFFLGIFRKIYTKKVFAYPKKFRSDSDNGRYGLAVLNILKDQKSFENFKRDDVYREILEHVTNDEGFKYLKILKSRNDGILEKALSTVLLSDELGNPIKFNYKGYKLSFSPTTLRYVKVASDLYKLFGNNLGNIAEIGCGYGGQALVNDQLLNVNSSKLFDLPFVNKLINRYLANQDFKGVYKTAIIDDEYVSKYDLVISNYAFSEMPKELQKIYIDKIISHSKSGYLTMNSGISGSRSVGKFSIDELRLLLPKFEVFEEDPLTSPHNYIIAWGFDKIIIPDTFKLKKLFR